MIDGLYSIYESLGSCKMEVSYVTNCDNTRINESRGRIMMISPERYYELYLKGKNEKQIMTAIRGLKKEIG